jgi:hypothetical protein
MMSEFIEGRLGSKASSGSRIGALGRFILFDMSFSSSTSFYWLLD